MVYLTTLCLITDLFLMNSGTNAGLLPKKVIPENYNLEIITTLTEKENNSFTFEGKIVITVKCLEPTDIIILNAVDLAIKNNIVIAQYKGNSCPMYIKGWYLNEENETLTITLDVPLKVDVSYDITIQFVGNINDNYRGYFRIRYTNTKANEPKWLALTHFKPTDARRAFPCFDEPIFKATFEISIGRSGTYCSVSNMPLEKTEPIEEKKGWFWDRFQKSVPISTYMVAYAVTQFKFAVAPKAHKDDISFRVWSREEVLDQTELARDIGPKALTFFEESLNITFPLSKQDLIVVPDLRSDAVENLGLITCKENMVFFDPKMSSFFDRMAVVSTLVHQLALQWFGNIVTVEWWTDSWLNEGFCTLMSSVAIHSLFPGWKAYEEKRMNSRQLILYFDSLENSNPVSVPVTTSNEISEITDTIINKKGHYLLFMIANVLGDEAFKRGMINYLERYKYGNAKKDDLWRSLNAEADTNTGFNKEGLDVKTVMDTWTLQAGYPVVMVNRSYENNSAQVTQKRFYLNTYILNIIDHQCWSVPLSYTNQIQKDYQNTRPKEWLDCSNNTKIINNIANKNEWIIFNIRASSLFRVNYDEKNWEMLISTLNSSSYTTIPVINRVQLIDDSATLAAADQLSYKIFFKILTYLEKERFYLPWKTAVEKIHYIYLRLRYTSKFGDFQNYIRTILQPMKNRMGNLTIEAGNEENMNNVKIKLLFLSLACKYKLGTCEEETKKMFKKFMNNPTKNQIANDLRSLVYCYGIKQGQEEEWNFLWKRYNETNSESEKQVIIKSLGCSTNVWLLQRYLEWTLKDDSGIRKQDRVEVFAAVAQNDVGFTFAKTFFEFSIEEIYEGMKSNTKLILTYLSTIAEQITGRKNYFGLKRITYYYPEIFSQLQSDVARALETAEINVGWQYTHLDFFSQYFLNE